jgi:hypothetical protein
VNREITPCAVLAGAVYIALLVSGWVLLLPVALLVVVVLFAALFRHRHRIAPFAITLVVLALQNVGAGMLGGANAEASLRVAIAFSAFVPAAILAGGWLLSPRAAFVALREQLRGEQLVVVAVALVGAGLVVARFVTGPVSFGAAVPSLRNALTPAYGLLVVLLLPPALRPDVAALGRWLGRWGVVIALAGVAELRLLGDRFWAETANIGAAISVKTLSVAHVKPHEVPADFYTHIGHNYFRRLVSIYGDAITTSYYLALALLAVVFLARLRSRFAIAAMPVLAVALVLGAAKGALGIVVIGVAVGVVLATRLRVLLPSGAAIVLVMCAGSVLFGHAVRYLPVASSIDLHVNGFTSAVHEVTSPLDTSFVWGDGIGTGGAGAVHAYRSEGGNLVRAQSVPGVDNGAGAILAQTGLLGLLSVFALFALAIDSCLRRVRESRASLFAAAALSALLANFLQQEHALTLITSLPFWFLAATAIPTRMAERVAPPVEEPIELEDERAEPAPEPEPEPDPIGTVTVEIVLDDEDDDVHRDDEVIPIAQPGGLRSVSEFCDEQVVDDRMLFDVMLADAAQGPGEFSPAAWPEPYNQMTINALHDGLRDFRRRLPVASEIRASDLAVAPVVHHSPSGASQLTLDVPQPDMRTLLAPFGNALRDEPALMEFELALFACRVQQTRVSGIRSIDDLDVSRVGSPFGCDNDGRFLTASALLYYRRYAYVGALIDFADVEVLIVVGAEGGEQVEVLKRLHPELTIVVVDHAPGLYVADRLLNAALPGDVVPYHETRPRGPATLQPGKIHFLLMSRLADIPTGPNQLLWSAGFVEHLDHERLETFARAVAPRAEWMFFHDCVPADDRGEERLAPALFPGHIELDRRPASGALVVPPPPGYLYEETFWVRRRRP